MLKTLLSEPDDILMTTEVVSKKRAARIERRKNKVAAIFNIKEVFKFFTPVSSSDLTCHSHLGKQHDASWSRRERGICQQEATTQRWRISSFEEEAERSEKGLDGNHEILSELIKFLNKHLLVPLAYSHIQTRRNRIECQSECSQREPYSCFTCWCAISSRLFHCGRYRILPTFQVVQACEMDKFVAHSRIGCWWHLSRRFWSKPWSFPGNFEDIRRCGWNGQPHLWWLDIVSKYGLRSPQYWSY